jgi:hypothetical protein
MRSRRLTVVLAILLWVPAVGAAQDLAPAPTVLAAAEDALAQTPPARIAHGARVWRCCNTKGAIIGAAIGAGIGYWIAMTCDAADCTSGYVKALVIMGGVGATVGAFSNIRSFPVGPRRAPLQIGVASRPGGPAGAVRVRF